MGHIIGPKGVTIAGFRQNSGCHVQVISNPIMPFGKVQIGPASLDKIATCVEMINAKLLDYVARGQAQAQITGMPAQIPPTLVDSEGNYVPIVALEIDTAQQLKELQDLGPTYPGRGGEGDDFGECRLMWRFSGRDFDFVPAFLKNCCGIVGLGFGARSCSATGDPCGGHRRVCRFSRPVDSGKTNPFPPLAGGLILNELISWFV